MAHCEDCVLQAILLGLGLQHRSVESLSQELNNLAVGQILGIFNQLIRQIQLVSRFHIMLLVFGVLVRALVISTKLSYVESGLYWDW